MNFNSTHSHTPGSTYSAYLLLFIVWTAVKDRHSIMIFCANRFIFQSVIANFILSYI